MRPRAWFVWAGLLVATLGVPATMAACGGHPSSRAGDASSGSTYQENLAYAHCMQSHGLPDFPDPNPSANFKISGRQVGKPSGPAGRANDACEHLLARVSTGANGTTGSAKPVPGRGAVAANCLTLRTSRCRTPQQLRKAYGIQALLDRGISGRGQTIVLPEFPPSAGSGVQVPTVTDIRQDLAEFDRRFHLPAVRLRVINTLAHAASPWLASIEEVEDTEIAHAVAPEAAIREVLIQSAPTADAGTVTRAVVAALRLGLAHADVVSLSAGAGEQCFTAAEVNQVKSVLQAAQRKRVTVVVSTGDSGAATTACPPKTGSAAVKGVDLPASDPLSLAVGGTSLAKNRKTGAYTGETVWNIPAAAGGPRAGGGGSSRLFPKPAYQDGIARIGVTRAVPDVAADADPRTGMALVITDGSEHTMLLGAGGASAAAPLWAAVVALADQYAGRRLGSINPALYRIGREASYHRAFHDVTSGTNSVDLSGETIIGSKAARGWDPVTGWGTPNAQALVPLLVQALKARPQGVPSTP